ncbi:MAG: extracellular solute-binding protein [Pseudomonadota bacterium]
MAHSSLHLSVAALALAALAAPVFASEVNVYSSRHYDTDDALYAAFTEETGIAVNRVEAKADELIARLEAEGANSPADVLITVDAGRMARAEDAGLLQAYDSATIEERIPDHFQHPDNLWYGIAQRARIIFYAKDRVENPPQTYEALADEAWNDKICIRSSSNIYNQSLMASIIETHGEDVATDWATGVLNNMAREPQGGDTDQLRGIVSGECDVVVSNHYYFLRGFAKDVEGLTSGIDNIGWVWPNQEDRGTHVNLTTAAITAHAPNAENALKLMEFLTSDAAQNNLSEGNHEYPAVEGASGTSTTERLGEFKADDTTPTSVFSTNAAKAQEVFNAVGWN